MTNLYTNQQIRRIEAYVIDHKIFSEMDLMERAGRAAFDALLRNWPESKRICVCCGKGKNGGDGYIVARLAQQQGLQVTVYSICDISELFGTALQAAELAINAGVAIIRYSSDIAIHADIVVDALLGSGLHGVVAKEYEMLIDAINAAECPTLAVDVPSGLNVDTGSIHGCAVQATLTITFIALKQGLFTNKGLAYSGEVIVDPLAVPLEIIQQEKPSAQLLEWDQLKVVLAHRRRRDTHKGDYGHLLVVGGDYGMGGAVRMAAEAALRVGAGLVTVATRPEHVNIVSANRPECMCHDVTKSGDLIPLVERASVILIGPGLGKSDWAKELLNYLLEVKLPKVLDADALNLLSLNPRHADDWILTPHPAEASRLLNTSTQEIQEDRFTSVCQLQKLYGGVSVLKGSGTLIKPPNSCVKICTAGNPGMATGGMGDVLSGVIGGLLAQKLSLSLAAEIGVMLHSLAADIAAQEGGERGLLATDLMQHLRDLVNP